MALTTEELREMQLLEVEEQQGLLEPPRASKGLTEQEALELAQLEKEERSGALDKEIVSPSEADLGFINRSRYSIEPIESNRRALLVQEFGQENVRDIDGESYIKQNNKWKPVNADGLSTADFADVAGAAPEIFGAGAGAVVGMGAGSVPAAMLGGAAGSVVRQGVSGLLGTPQGEATAGERIAETALSGAMAGAGSVAAKGGKWAIKKAVRNARKLFPKLEIDIDGKELLKIAKEQGLPKPTVGQMAGGKHLEVEKALGERRFWGRGVRKQSEEQVEKIKNNLIKEVGEFVETTSDRAGAGFKLKELAGARIRKTKEVAGGIFDKVTEAGKDVTLPRKDFQVSLINNFNKLGIFDMEGRPMKHTFETGLTAEQFKRVQGVFGKLLDGTKAGASDANSIGVDVINVNTINTMRKFLDGNIKEGSLQGVDNVLLLKLRSKLMDTAEDMLSKKSDYHRSQFQIARNLWSDYITQSRNFEKMGKGGIGIKDLSDEKVLQRVFNSAKNVKTMKGMSHPKHVEEAGIEYINDLFTQKLSGSGQASAQGVITSMKKSREAIIEAVGKAKYKKIMDNLFYLNKIGKPINPSRTAIVKMMDLSPTNLFSGAMERANYGMKKALIPMEGFAEETLKKNRALAPRGLSALSDEWQRDAAGNGRPPSKRVKPPYRREKKKMNRSIWEKSQK